jgi:uncharacterized protein (DUF1778 family)
MAALAQTVLSVRMSASERELLETAAGMAHTSLSDFVRRHVLMAAEDALADRRIVEIPAENWVACEAWAAAPGRAVLALQRLAASSEL